MTGFVDRGSPLEFNGVALLLKAKLRRDRSRGKWPVVVVGWMREIRSNEEEWALPWLANLPLLPPEREPFSVLAVVACEATTTAESRLGYSGLYHARQHFRVLTVFHGAAEPNQRLAISYSYLETKGRDVAQGEQVIWVLTGNQKRMQGYAAVPDTAYHRQEARDLAARLKATPPRTRFDLLDLSLDKAKVATVHKAELPGLFAETTADPKRWPLRKQVKVVYSGPDGEVYSVPEKGAYYVRRDIYSATGARSQPRYYGPFPKDPSLLPSARRSGGAEGKRD